VAGQEGIDPPIFVAEGFDLVVFESVSAAEGHVESPDVDDLVTFDSQGRELRFLGKTEPKGRWIKGVAVGPVQLIASEEHPTHQEALRLLILSCLQEANERVDGADDLPLQDLVEVAQAKFTHKGHGRSPTLTRKDQLANARRANERLVDRPVASTLLALLPMLLVFQTLIWIKPPTGPNNTLGWICLAMLIYTPFLVATVPRFTKQTSEHSVVLRWSLSYSPFLMAFVSVMSKGPEWPLGLAIIETSTLVIITMVTARRERERSR
jgi:hypothetical protein